MNKSITTEWGDMIAKSMMFPSSEPSKVQKTELPAKDMVMNMQPVDHQETDAAIARRLGLKQGAVVRLPDADGQPVRKRIKSVDQNGQVTLEGSRKKIPAHKFHPR